MINFVGQIIWRLITKFSLNVTLRTILGIIKFFHRSNILSCVSCAIIWWFRTNLYLSVLQ